MCSRFQSRSALEEYQCSGGVLYGDGKMLPAPNLGHFRTPHRAGRGRGGGGGGGPRGGGGGGVSGGGGGRGGGGRGGQEHGRLQVVSVIAWLRQLCRLVLFWPTR